MDNSLVDPALLERFIAYAENPPVTWLQVASLALQSLCFALLLVVRSVACRIARGATPSSGAPFMWRALGIPLSGSARRGSPTRGRRSASRLSRRKVSDGETVSQVGPTDELSDVAARVGVSPEEIRAAIGRRAAYAADTVSEPAGPVGDADADRFGSGGAYVPPSAR